MQETSIRFLSWEDPLEKEMITHSSIFPEKSHGQGSLVGYSPWGRKRIGHDLVTKQLFSCIDRIFENICGAKPLTVWITINCGKFWKRWEYQTTWPASWETCIQVRKQQLILDVDNRLVPNRKRSTSRLILQPCLFNLYAEYIMRNPGLDKAPARIKILPGEISLTLDMQMISPL